MVILPEYSYLNDILNCMQNHEKLPVHEIFCFGSRFSGKTINEGGEFVIKAVNLVDASGSEFVKVGAYVYRNERTDLLMTWDDYNTFIDNEVLEQGFEKKESRTTWLFANGNKVVFDFTKKKTKNKTYGKGLTQIIGDYIIVVIEEATEMPAKSYKDIYNGIRGLNPKAEILFIYICNPENPANHLVKKVMQYLPFDEAQMRETGHQFKLVNTIGLDEADNNTLIHYVNWRAIQKYHTVPAPQTKLGYRYIADEPIIVPQYKLDNLVKAYEIDELSAKVDDIGCPGASTDNMFLRYMPFIDEPIYYKHSFVVGGGDLGWGKTTGSGYTAFHFYAYDSDGSTDIYATYKWDQKIKFKNQLLILQDIVEFYITEAMDYASKTGDSFNDDYPLIVKVDNSAATDISYLNEYAKSRGVNGAIVFVPCVKVNRWDRFRAGLYLCAANKVRINKQKCAPLIEEMCNIQTDGEASSFKTIGADHALDAWFYGYGTAFYNFRVGEQGQQLSDYLRSKRF